MPTFRSYDQTEISYEVHGVAAGARLPLLLLHGFPFDARLWSLVLPGLAAHTSVIVPDLRGFGRSSVPAGPYRMEDHARDMVALLAHLGIDRALVGGHSMGGYAALALAERFPQHVAGLALLHSHPFADDEAGRKARYELASTIATLNREAWNRATRIKALATPVATPAETNLLADPLGGGTPTATPTDRFGSHDPLGGGTPARSKAGGVAVLDRMVAEATPAAIAAAAVGMALRPDRTDVWRSFPGPTLFVAGARDQFISPERATTIRAMRSGLHDRSATLPSGHVGMLDAPAEFVQAVVTFLLGTPIS